jgi:hypothetical protein
LQLLYRLLTDAADYRADSHKHTIRKYAREFVTPQQPT